MQSHDTVRRVRQLQQALASDKVAVAVLLGSGCASSIRVKEAGNDAPLIPDTAGLTKALSARLEGQVGYRDVYGRVLGQLAEDGNAAPNLEDILSHVRALRQAAGKSEGRGGVKGDLLKELDNEICRITEECVRKPLPGTGTGYHRLASWISSIRREHPVELFTTNYDLLMEQALEAQRVPFFDGFAGSWRAFFDPTSMIADADRFPSHWCRLWKLHGSVNWWRDDSGVVWRGGRPPLLPSAAPLIHPSHLKYEESRRMPYLAMIDRLRAHLRRTRAVVVTCGFSFTDQHLNEVLDEGLQGNASAVCFALAHGDLTKYANAVELAHRRSNLNLWARDQAIVGTKEGEWTLEANTPAPPPWAAEVEKSSAGPEEAARCRLLLGDFARFGELLAEQMGTPPESTMVANVT
jgi:hypothetical protein